MQVILTKNIPGLGYTGDVKNVKPGYFRNFLFPQELAVRATQDAIAQYDAMKEEIMKQKAEVLEKAEETVKKLHNMAITFHVKASDKGTLYGSITEDDVVARIKDNAKMELDRSVVAIDGGHIKTVGDFTATIRLTEKHKAEIKIHVVASE